MNSVSIFGRLANDVKMYGDETPVARFSVAVDRYYKGEHQADFISCVAFGKTAEYLEKYAEKGSQICVLGSLKTGSYEKDGEKRYTMDVFCERCELGSKPKEATPFDEDEDFEAPAKPQKSSKGYSRKR